MRQYKLKDKAIATGKQVWMGIDAHKKQLDITILDAEEVLWHGPVPHGRAHIEALVGRLVDCRIVAVYESGPTGYKLLHWLKELGCEAFMTPASKVPTEKGGKQIKTDTRDSLELAKLARADMLKAVHDLGEEAYLERELTRTREQLVKHRRRVMQQIKSKLLYHGIDIPEELSATWSKAFLSWLAQGPSSSPHLNEAIGILVTLYRGLSKQIDHLEKRIEALAKTKKYQKRADLLQTVPGIAALTAMVLLVELGDVSRFECGEEFASFLGLVPGEWSSGQTRRKRALLRWGNKRARTALVEASWILIGKDPQMRKVYERIKARRGAGRAIVAVARRLALVIRAMLNNEEPYQYTASA